MRILLAGEGTRGDLQPLIELAVRLAAAGHDPLVCGPPDFAELASPLGVAYRSLGGSMVGFMTERAAVISKNPLRVLREAVDYVKRHLTERLVALGELAADADLVLAGGAEIAASSAAERHGVAYRYVCYCPQLLPSREHTPPFVNFDRGSPWLNRALWPIVLGPIDRAVRRLLTPARDAIGLAPIGDAYASMLGPRPLLAADAALATPPRDARLPIEQIPALHPLGGEPLPAKLAAFLEAGPAPVFVGFGSMPDPDPVATTRRVVAAVERLGVRAILSAGWARLGGVPLPEGLIETGPVAHPRLFPRCAAIVHHGGAGTTTNALRAGVPQVLVPHLADQFYWGRRVRELGIGLATPRKHRVGTDDLVAALDAVLGNEAVAERARELGARAHGAAVETDPIPTILR